MILLQSDSRHNDFLQTETVRDLTILYIALDDYYLP